MIDRVCSLTRQSVPNAENEGLLSASGATVPAATTNGYQTGCIFSHTDGSAGTAFYVNEGTFDSCDFAAVAGLTADQEALLSATAGTVSASKAVIVDASKDITGLNDVAVDGTLDVTGVLSLTAAPVVTAVTAAASETATMTNAPAAGNPSLWLTVTVDSVDYVIPAFASA